MKNKSPLFAVCLSLIGFLSLSPTTKAQVYSNDFSSSSVADLSPVYVGGFFTPQAAFGQWYGKAGEASISGGELLVDSTFGLRGAFLILNPTVFGSDTDFRLTLDVTSLNLGAAGNTATARVFTGTGYDLTLSSPNSLIMNPQTGGVTPSGAASVVMAAENTLSLGSGQTIDFTRPDGHAVMVFLGVGVVGGFPFPEMSVNGMTIDAIPEPSSFLLVSMGSLALLRRKRPAHA